VRVLFTALVLCFAGIANSKIAVLLPLSSGNEAERVFAEQTLANIYLAADKSAFDIYDTASSDAITAIEKAIAQKATGVIGPLSSEQTKIVAKYSKMLPIISLSNDSKLAGSGAFIIGFFPDKQAETLVKFANAKGYRQLMFIGSPSRLQDAMIEGAKKAVLDISWLSNNPKIDKFELNKVVKSLDDTPPTAEKTALLLTDDKSLLLGKDVHTIPAYDKTMLGYDAAKMLLSGIPQVGTKHNGKTGAFTILPNGLADRSYAVK
jgi:hypothetical protein